MILELKSRVVDASLNEIKNYTETLYICNQVPTTFLEASSTYAIGSKAAPTFTGPVDGVSNTRVLTVNAITDGVVLQNGDGVYAVLTDDSLSDILGIWILDVPLTVNGQTAFTLTSFQIAFGLIAA
jgi:hypothetical protein